MHDVPLAVHEVRAIAASDGRLDGDIMPMPDERWPTVLSGLAFQRLTGIAVAAFEAGRLDLSPEQEEELLDRHRAAMVLSLSIERRLLRLMNAFDEAGVRAVVLKGTAVAHALYPDPSIRPFGDLDLLVSTTEWDRACAALRRCGFERDLPAPRRGFDQRFGKAATHSDAEGIQVDLHRTLVLGPFGLWLDPDELLRHTETFSIGGRTVERLDRTGMLLNALLHAALGSSPPLLLPLCDVVRASRDPGVDWQRLGRWVASWRLSAAVAFAFETAERQLGVELPSATRSLTGQAPGHDEVRAMRAYTDRRRMGGLAMAATRAIPGLRGKAAYVFGLLLPSRDFLRARARGGPGASYRSRWRAPVRWMAARRRRPEPSVRAVRPMMDLQEGWTTRDPKDGTA